MEEMSQEFNSREWSPTLTAQQYSRQGWGRGRKVPRTWWWWGPWGAVSCEVVFYSLLQCLVSSNCFIFSLTSLERVWTCPWICFWHFVFHAHEVVGIFNCWLLFQSKWRNYIQRDSCMPHGKPLMMSWHLRKWASKWINSYCMWLDRI